MRMEQIIQLSSGRGPKECCLAVQHVFHKLQSECLTLGISMHVIEQELEAGLPASMLLKLEGKELQTVLKRWVGTIQWICPSPFRPKHPRKNWFIAVQMLSKSPELLELNEQDVQFQTMRSSGAGGQHVNKVSSAVRATHKPTGISVQVMDSRSQLQNKQIAMQRLKQQIADLHEKDRSAFKKQAWSDQIEINRGNPILIFYGEKFKEK